MTHENSQPGSAWNPEGHPAAHTTEPRSEDSTQGSTTGASAAPQALPYGYANYYGAGQYEAASPFEDTPRSATDEGVGQYAGAHAGGAQYGTGPSGAYPGGAGGYPPPPGTGVPADPGNPKPGRRKRTLLGIGAGALAAALVLGGMGIERATSSTDGSGTVALSPANGALGNGVTGNGSTGDGTSGSGTSGDGTGSGTIGGGTSGSGTGGYPGSGSGQGSTTSSGTAATSTQQSGIVTIVSVLGYENAESAGTGMILTSDGEILTNNHVIDGATSITVTVETTGKSYKATVVGTDPTDDVAVLQLSNASGLTKAKIGDSSDVSVGDSVTGVGNAGGTGDLTQVSGQVTALNQSITATDDSGSNAEKLTGLIETNADIVAGDSGGPLYDSDGEIVGIDTAASASNGAQTTAQTSTSQAYAIPIDSALAIADKIESGVETSTIHIGLPAFLGVGLSESSTTGGATVNSVLNGGAAATAGITAGSVITALGGTTIDSATALSTAMASYEPGQKVKVSWTDESGSTHTATVTLGTGPAD